MSYQVIARKWRPRTFEEVSGQGHITEPLRNVIATERVPHAILLTGPRGVGKTTLARILARCLNCDNGPTETPCGTCVACSEISEGLSRDVQEVDAASRTGVDDARELIDSIRYAAAPGKHRIFVVDEVHMLSKNAWNALLKTLEEPPPSSLFIFATTEPERIPVTVLSRCQRYDLLRISTKEISERLRSIAEAEDLSISESSLLAIAREGDGSMRDAQTLFDQIIAHSGTDVRDEVVAQVLDLIDRHVLLEILTACIDSQPAEALAACSRAAAGGSTPKRISELLVGLLRDLVVVSIAPDVPGLIEGTDEERDELRELAQRSESTRLRRMFRALTREQEDLAWAPDPMAVLEMAVVRLATLASGDDVSRLLGRIEALEQALAGSGGNTGGGGTRGGGGKARRAPTRERTRPDPAQATPAPTQATPAPTQATPAPTQAAPAPTQATPAPTQATPAPTQAAPAPTQATPAPTQATPAPTQATPIANAPAPPASTNPSEAPPPGAPLDVVFDRLRSHVRKDNPGLFAVLQATRLTAREPGRLCIETPSSFNRQRLDDKREAFESICSKFFGTTTQVEISETAATAEPDGKVHHEESRRSRQEALNHPLVNTALQVLQADIVEIRPLGGRSSGPK